MKPNESDIKLKDNFIELKDFEYYKNKEYNPIFMRTLANSIYTINSIFRDNKDNIEIIKSLFESMPFGFGIIKNEENKNLDIVLYSTTNEEYYYECLNNEDFLIDLKDELKDKVQEDFTFQKEENRNNKTYIGMIYEENIIVNIKNIVNNELKELPNIIYYMNQEKKEKIENIIKIFDIKNNVINLNFEIKDEQKPKKKIKKEYYGYNQLDLCF